MHFLNWSVPGAVYSWSRSTGWAVELNVSFMCTECLCPCSGRAHRCSMLLLLV